MAGLLGWLVRIKHSNHHNYLANIRTLENGLFYGEKSKV